MGRTGGGGGEREEGSIFCISYNADLTMQCVQFFLFVCFLIMLMQFSFAIAIYFGHVT